MSTCVDMIGRTIQVPDTIQSVICLVPSITEFLLDLNLDEIVIGRTVFCISPSEKVKSIQQVGGTKKVRFDTIEKLNPDLIICNKEENTVEIVETLSKNHVVWVSDVKTLEDAYKMMSSLGKLLKCQNSAEALISSIKSNFSQSKIYRKYTCLYLIWRKPYMSIGKDTFIHHLLDKSGFYNILNNEIRYPELDEETIALLRPEVVFLSSEPYPFSNKHIQEIRNLLPNSKILTVEGDLFSWYGSRLIQSQPYFNELQRKIHRGIN